MEEWKEYKLGDVCTIVGRIGFRGYTKDDLVSSPNDGAITLSPSNIVDGEIDISKVAYINWEKYNESPEIMLKKGDVVLSKTATIGRVAIVREIIHPITLNPQLVVLKDIKVNPDFLAFFLKTPYFQGMLKSITVGSVVATLSQKNLSNLKIKLPETKVQNRISNILLSLVNKIEVNRKINENLEQQAQALFKSWFIDFEPFKNGEFVESELGRIPKGWRVGTFLDNIKVMPGGTPSTSRSEYWDDGTIPFFSPKDVNGVYCFETEKSITELGLNNCSSNLYPKDTLFITARGTVGKLTLAGVPMAMNQSNYALVAREGVGKYYLYLITQTLVSVLLKKANGAVFSAITTRDFNEPTLMPTHNDLKNFELLVTPIFKKIFQTSVESRRLAELRDTLLPKLMSGEIKVNELN